MLKLIVITLKYRKEEKKTFYMVNIVYMQMF